MCCSVLLLHFQATTVAASLSCLTDITTVPSDDDDCDDIVLQEAVTASLQSAAAMDDARQR